MIDRSIENGKNLPDQMNVKRKIFLIFSRFALETVAVAAEISVSQLIFFDGRCLRMVRNTLIKRERELFVNRDSDEEHFRNELIFFPADGSRADGIRCRAKVSSSQQKNGLTTFV